MGSTYTNTAGSWAAGDYYGTSNQVNLMATLNNTFYITGIQLEVGEQATPFEHRSYADELLACQRYFEIQEFGFRQTTTHNALVASGIGGEVPCRVVKRAAGTLTRNDGTTENIEFQSQSSSIYSTEINAKTQSGTRSRFFGTMEVDSEL